jgi:SSS family solute:Na+ symporter
MVARFYSIKSEKMITKGAIVSTIFAIFIAGGSYFLGSFGRLYADMDIYRADGSVIFDAIVPAMLSNFNEVMIGVVILLVFAASISTLSSLVMASASTLTLDFLKGHIIKKMADKKQLLIIRSMIVVFIAISSAIAILQIQGNIPFIQFIADLMGVSWGALAGAFLAPFLYGLYWKRATKAAVWVNFAFSTVLMTFTAFFWRQPIFTETFLSPIAHPIKAGAFCMLAGLVIVPLVSLVSKAPENEKTEQCFSCYEEKVSVKIKGDLGG